MPIMSARKAKRLLKKSKYEKIERDIAYAISTGSNWIYIDYDVPEKLKKKLKRKGYKISSNKLEW